MKTLRRLILLLALIGLGTVGALALLAGPSVASDLPDTAQLDHVFAGLVFEGNLGDESSPITAVTVELWGTYGGYPQDGDLLDTAVTDLAGAYSLTVMADLPYEFYYLLEVNLDGYSSTAATTIDGAVLDVDLIEFSLPLEGKDLTGNKFWDQAPEMPTYTFQGRVYQGAVGDQSTPMPDVTVGLWGANNPHPDPGTLLMTTTTDSAGWYGLTLTELAYEVYSLREENSPDMVSVGATTVSGTVETADWIAFSIPLDGLDLSGNKFWDTPAGGELGPDLVIAGAWADGQTLCYEGWNQGDQPAEGGHETLLLIDDAPLATHQLDETILPGDAWLGCYVLPWVCTTPADSIELAADHADVIVESNETNNTWSDTWACDETPPVFVAGPEVVQVGSDYGLIAWETDEPADTVLLWGGRAGERNELGDPELMQAHMTLLEGLEPARTYYVIAQSSDAAGNTASSRQLAFETLPPPDGEVPTITLLDPGQLQGMVVITATAADDTGIGRVVFYLDGQMVHTDYSAPYNLTLDSTLLGNGSYPLEARAYDGWGNQMGDSLPVSVLNPLDLESPTVQITTPADGATVSGQVSVTASLNDDSGIISARFYVDDDYREFEPFSVTNPPTSTTVTFVWDSRSEANGTGRRLTVKVYDLDGKEGSDWVDVTVDNSSPPPASPPWLEVTNHGVARNGNRFVVLLSVKNTGDEAARNVRILDGLRGFQPIEELSVAANIYPEYDPVGGFGYADIRPATDIAAGETRLFLYNVVPFLAAPTAVAPSIGFFVDLNWDSVSYTGYHNYVSMPVAGTSGGESIAQAYQSALASADYLIVTNPYRLFAIYNPTYYQGASTQRTQANQLLSTMAELAFYKQGVLGYNTTYNSESLRDLIKVGGVWSSKLAPGWTSNGYLLIVGEVDLVTAWWRYYGTQYTTKGDRAFITSFTDYPYASTYGDEMRPELSIGRIIGSGPFFLRRPLQTAINLYLGETGYDYDGLTKLVASGFDACMHGGCDTIYFKTEVNNVIKVLPGPIVGIHTPDLAVYVNNQIDITATKAAIVSTFFANSPGKDIVFLAGHGNGGSWDGINVDSVHAQTTPFGGTNPFIFASACGTATYPPGVSLAESFLNRYAGSYMGAIAVGACYEDHTCPHADTFFSQWQQGEAFATTLKQTKNKIGSNFFDRYWAGIYHIFGDAKFGASDTTPGTAAQTVPSYAGLRAPAGVVTIELPEIAFEPVGDHDSVVLPGSIPLMEPGRPVLPAYVVTYDYPAGTQIQDVLLTGRAEPELYTGLYLLTTTIALAGDAQLLPRAPLVADGFWPETAFHWEVFESPTTTTLMITLYPFQYNSGAASGLFYRAYELDIQTTESPLAITALDTDAAVYEPDQPVTVDLTLENLGELPLDVVVEVSIREAASGRFVTGLLLETLKELAGSASFTAYWDPAGYEPGDYSVLVELLDTQGTRLDRWTESFQVGSRTAASFGLAADPPSVSAGEPVALSLLVENTGSIPLTGTVVLLISSQGAGEVAVLTTQFPELGPGGHVLVTEEWDTAGLLPGRYQVVGYALYLGSATDPQTTEVLLENRVYLPALIR